MARRHTYDSAFKGLWNFEILHITLHLLAVLSLTGGLIATWAREVKAWNSSLVLLRNQSALVFGA